MNLFPDQAQGLYLLAVVVGFFGWVVAGPLPASGHGISRMAYFVRTGALALGTTLAVLLAAALVTGSAAWSSASVFPVVAAAIGLGAGAYAGLVALGRSFDSGGRRGFAALGIVPFANLWLGLAAPAADPARPPYRPASPFLRFLIGFLALTLGLALSGGLNLWMASPAGIALVLDREVAALNAGLPRQLDEVTTLVRVRHEAAGRRLIYEHRLATAAGADLTGLADQMKVSAVATLCADPAVLDVLASGYAMHYAFETDGGNALPSFAVAHNDCPDR